MNKAVCCAAAIAGAITLFVVGGHDTAACWLVFLAFLVVLG
jgi:hypothetical protein